MQRHLFKEFEFTGENVRKWAEDEVANQPTINIVEWNPDTKRDEYKTIANSVEHVLRGVLAQHYSHELSEYKKSELLDECLGYIMNGISKPCCDMTVDELLCDIIANLALETMDDLIEWLE